MDNTIIMQGRFTSAGVSQFIPLRGGVDWIEVFNTTAVAAGGNVGFQFYWQNGMPQGGGYVYNTPGGVIVQAIAAGAGFYSQDTSIITNTRSANVITNISNASPPRVTSNGHGLVTGDIVRLVQTVGALQIDGIDYRVTRIDGNNFDLSWMSPIATAAAPGANARFYKISSEGLYVPNTRVITSISQAQQAVVVFAAPHHFTVGQEIRFKVSVRTPVAFGMTQINNLIGTVLAVDTAANSVTVDIDTTGFTAFAFPLTANVPYTPAQCVPVGEDTAEANLAGVDPLGDAVFNVSQIGMLLQPGTLSPAGQAADVIYWKAGVSFSVDNE